MVCRYYIIQTETKHIKHVAIMGDHYEYIAVYDVDDLMIASRNPQVIIDALTSEPINETVYVVSRYCRYGSWGNEPYVV